jgi:hypothetical protein
MEKRIDKNSKMKRVGYTKEEIEEILGTKKPI